jgi:hypothetical protein
LFARAVLVSTSWNFIQCGAERASGHASTITLERVPDLV